MDGPSDRHVRIPADEPPPPPSPEELELEREMEYFGEPEEAFTRDESLIRVQLTSQFVRPF